MKKVVVIYDVAKYDDATVLDELRAEGFKWEFKLSSSTDFAVSGSSYVDEADEVWTFGDVEGMHIYKYAKAIGADIWKMA